MQTKLSFSWFVKRLIKANTLVSLLRSKNCLLLTQACNNNNVVLIN